MTKRLTGETVVFNGLQLKVSFETSGYEGGDGSKLVIHVDGVGESQMHVWPVQDDILRLTFHGDIELNNAVEAFEFLAKHIRQALGPKQT